MSLSNQTVRQVYVGNGSLTDFAIPFAFKDNSQIDVYLVDDSDPIVPVITEQVLTTDYTLIGGVPPTDVSFVTAPASGIKVVVARGTTLQQTLDLINSGENLPEDIETNLDKLVMMMQEIFDRSIKLPAGYQFTSFETMPAPVPNGFIAFNSDGDGFTYYELNGDELTFMGAGYSASDADPLVASATLEINPNARRQIIYVEGDGAPITLDTVTAIESGTFEGQELVLVGLSNTNTVTILASSANMRLNGDKVLGLDDSLKVVWDDVRTVWREI